MSHDEMYRERWLNRIQQGKRKYFFERFKENSEKHGNSFLKVAAWFKEDVVYVFRWTLNVFIQISTYGYDIKKNYDASYSRQFYRMMYLVLVTRVKPNNFRKYRLFKQNNWQKVNDFVFAHAGSQRTFSNYLFPEEVDLFLNKFLFSEFCKIHGFYSPNILAAYDNGECIFLENPDYKLPKKDLFIKKMSGMMGMGALKLVYQEGVYVDNDGRSYNEEGVFNLLKETSRKKYPIILQCVIKNHFSWSKFTSGSLATCRIVTYRLPDNSEIKPFFATFRMPVGGMNVDNFSAGGIAAPVKVESGTLGKVVGTQPVDGFYEFTHHPDTKQKIEGTVIPEWDPLLGFALRLHKKVRSAFVGWDICLTEQGYCVLEGSLEWGATTYESPYEDPIKNTLYPGMYEKWMEIGSGSHE